MPGCSWQAPGIQLFSSTHVLQPGALSSRQGTGAAGALLQLSSSQVWGVNAVARHSDQLHLGRGVTAVLTPHFHAKNPSLD